MDTIEIPLNSNNQKVAAYYDVTLPFYKRLWHRDEESNALHYGFWEKGTKSVKEALLNENRFLAEKAGITTGTKVLDAGCGIGGSTIWLAKQRGAHVVGITISARQLDKAKELAKQAGVEDTTKFYLKDFTTTGFPDHSFDVVWAIESVCHAEDKNTFLQEAYRVLKSGGKLIVADGFLWREPCSAKEKRVYRECLKGLVLPNLAHADQFKQSMQSLGFKNIVFWDKTAATKPSAKILYRRVLFFYPLTKLLNMLHIIPDVLMNNSRAGLAQLSLVNSGTAGYGVFLGEK